MLDRLLEYYSLRQTARILGLTRRANGLAGPGFEMEIRYRNKQAYCDCKLSLDGFPPYLKLARQDLLNETRRTHDLTGDEDFDDAFGVVTQKRESALQYLTNDRRGLLLQCLHPFTDATLEGSTLKATFIHDILDYRAMVEHLKKLLLLQQNLARPPLREPRAQGWVNRSLRGHLFRLLAGTGMVPIFLSSLIMMNLPMSREIRGGTTEAYILLTAFYWGAMNCLAGFFAYREFRIRRTAILAALGSFYIPATLLFFKLWDLASLSALEKLAALTSAVAYSVYVLFIDQMVEKTMRHGHR